TIPMPLRELSPARAPDGGLPALPKAGITRQIAGKIELQIGPMLPHNQKVSSPNKVARMRLSEKLAHLARTTRADMLNASTEQVIAQCRLLLCALSSLAISLEPTQPAQYAAATAFTLFAYLAFSAILVALTRYRFLSPRTRQAIHFADVVIISVLLCL